MSDVEPKGDDVRPWLVAIVVLWAAAYLPALSVRDLRGEEGRRAIPAREMLQSGDFVLPTLFGDAYLNKPPLHFWIISLIGGLRGEVDVWATRIPSALAALACALLMLALGKSRLPLTVRGTAALAALASPTLLDKGTQGEMDAVLSALVLAAWVVWWGDRGADGTGWRGWLGSGFLLGLAVLCKGPGGPTQFYLGVATWLVWKRRARELLTLRHLGAVVIMTTPVVLWVVAIVLWKGVSLPSVLATWRGQTGFGTSYYVVLTTPFGRSYLAQHVLEILQKVALMCAPWCLIAAPAFIPRAARRLRVDADFRLFLTLAFVANLVLFLVHPTSRPRYMMAAVLLVCPLAACVVVGWEPALGVGRLAAIGQRLPAQLGVSTVVVAGAGVVGTLWRLEHVTPGILLLVTAAAWAIAVVRWGRALSARSAWLPATLALAGLVLVGRGAAANVFLPVQAERDETRRARATLPALRDETIFTTRRFELRAEDWYEVFFHVTPMLRGAEADELAERAPCLALVTPAEAEILDRLAPGACRREGIVPKITDCSTELVLVRIDAPSRQ